MGSIIPTKYATMERETSHNAGSSFHLERGVQVNQGATATFGAINYHPVQAQPTESSLQDLLKFPEMTYREHAIASVHDGTGRWLLNTKEYLDWAPGARTEQNDSQDDWKRRMLWIIGNAGAGKSALMKMALRHAQSTYHDCLIFPHFFNARGTTLEKSAEGMYRTLIYWLLEEIPSTTAQRLKRRLRLPTPINWATPILAELLQNAISELTGSPILFFVDALDECDEDEVYTMLSVFQNLVKKSKSQQVHVCFASRPHPHFGFDGATYLIIGSQEEHSRDIDTFVNERLRIGTSPLAQDVKREVKERAQGIFMWAVLVTQTLNSDFNHGNITMLHQRLREIPAGLHELFHYTILECYTTDYNALLVCFQWLLFGDGRFQVERLWWATQRGLGRDDQSICRDYDAMDANDMQLWINSISKGLVEFPDQIMGDRTAQFVHESVRDFIFKDTDMLSLYGAQDASNLAARSHEQFRDCCLAEINARQPEVLKLTTKYERPMMLDVAELGWQPYGQAASFPFACYAYGNILFHANIAQKGGHDQTLFLESFAQQTGPDFSVRFPGLPDHITFYGSLISVLLLFDCDALIRETQAQPAQTARELGQAFGLADDHFGISGLWEATLHGSEKAINALIEIYMQLNHDKRHSVLQSTLKQLAETWQDDYCRFGNPGSTPVFGLLHLASLNPTLATFFLIVLAPLETLQPHLHELHHFTRPLNEQMIAFLQVLHLFVYYKLHSDAINIAEPSSIDWLFWLQTARAKAGTQSNRDSPLWIESCDPKEQQMIILLCKQLEEYIRALLPA